MRFCLLIITFLFTSALYAQVIKGKVVDTADGKPIDNANVYLNGTFKGTATDNEGNFIIHTTEKNIPLIISHVGYETQTVTTYADKDVFVFLKKRANILREVTIGHDYRDEAMKIFLREFIGNSTKECVITNPDDISFVYHHSTGELSASADKPIGIVNKKFGYKITYFLSAFHRTTRELDFQGNYFFAEDTTGLDLKTKRRVLIARNDAYFGSRMHFVRAAWANNLQGQNFYVFDHFNHPMPYDSLVLKYKDDKYLRLKKEIRVEYKYSKSFLNAASTLKYEFIAANGFFDPNITWAGDMASERLGDMLPFEFEPIKR